MALCKHAPKLDPGAHATMRVRTKAVHHAVRIDRQENSGYRPSRVNTMAQGLSTPDPSFSPYTHLSLTEVVQQLHYTHY